MKMWIRFKWEKVSYNTANLSANDMGLLSSIQIPHLSSVELFFILWFWFTFGLLCFSGFLFFCWQLLLSSFVFVLGFGFCCCYCCFFCLFCFWVGFFFGCCYFSFRSNLLFLLIHPTICKFNIAKFVKRSSRRQTIASKAVNDCW